MLIAFLKFQ